jgi:hypothetical protein
MIHYLPVVTIVAYANGLLSASRDYSFSFIYILIRYLNDLFIIEQSLLVIHLDCMFYDNFFSLFNLLLFFSLSTLYQTLLIKKKSRFNITTKHLLQILYINIH